MGKAWSGNNVGKNSRDCMISLIPMGVCMIGLGIAANIILPVCYQVWAQVMTLGVLYMVAGSISISAANGRRKSNYLSQISVSMTLHVLCWVGSAFLVAVAVNLMTKSFGEVDIITQCPYGGPARRDEHLYYIFGGVTLGVMVVCLILSSISFQAFWKSPEMFEPIDMAGNEMQMEQFRSNPPRKENVYITPTIQQAGDVARSVWPSSRTPSYSVQEYPPSGAYSSGQITSGGNITSRGKSLRIVSADRHIRKACVVASMRELILVAREKLRFNGEESLVICYDATGEEIEDEPSFQSIPEYTRLMVYSGTMNECWEPPKYGYVNNAFGLEPPDYSTGSLGHPTVYQL